METKRGIRQATKDAALGEVVMIATRAAWEWLDRQSHHQVDAKALAPHLRARLQAAIPAALEDAKEAIECRMTEIAAATFAASIKVAGIAAGRDALAAEVAIEGSAS